jgi:hypothetical protein
MILKLVRGCVCDSMTADGVEEIDMTPKQRQETIDAIFRWLKKNPDQLNYVMQDLISDFGDYECDDEPCECCGDLVQTYTWEID